MERPKAKDRYEVLLALDEFRHLGPMPQLLSMLTISAGYKFRMAIVIQSISMLDELYGKPVRQTTLAGSQVKLFIKIDDLDTANYVSEMLGDRTIKVETPGAKIGAGLFASKPTQTHYEAQPLMSAPEVRLLSFGKSILFVSGARPFLVDKVQHYRDQPLKAFLAALWGHEGYTPNAGRVERRGHRPVVKRAGTRNEPQPAVSEVTDAAAEVVTSSALPLVRDLDVTTDAPYGTTTSRVVVPAASVSPTSQLIKSSPPRPRKLSPAPPVKGVVRDYPAPVVVDAARLESDAAFRELIAPFDDGSQLKGLPEELTRLNATFGQPIATDRQ